MTGLTIEGASVNHAGLIESFEQAVLADGAEFHDILELNAEQMVRRSRRSMIRCRRVMEAGS